MKKSIIVGLVSWVLAPPVFATEYIELDGVVITASRTPQSRESVLGDVTLIDQKEIERAGASSITDLLQTQPGIQMSSNGGAGKTSNLFIRGTNKDHMVVLIDGMRINSATAGTTAFENIPLAQIERIEILRGPASSLYGADAIGGVIQIFTKKGSLEKPSIHAAIGIGSYNTKTADAGIANNFGDTHFAINVSNFDTRGFSAKRNGINFDRDNDAYRNIALTSNLSRQINENHEIGVQFFQSSGNNEYDCSTATKDGSVCEIKQTLRSYGIYSHNHLLPTWQSTLRMGLSADDSKDFSGKSAAGAISYSNFSTEQRQITWQNDITLPVGALTLAYERLEQRINSTSAYTRNTRDNNGYLASYRADIGNHAMQISIRDDENSQFGSHATGGLGYGYHITPEWRISTNYGTAIKSPTFNQLYFPGIPGYSGNPNLQPEESRNGELSIRYETDKLRASTTLFDNKIDNLIVNGDPVKNLNKAEIQGITFDGYWQIADRWAVLGNFTTQSPRVVSSNVAAENNQLLDRRGNRYGTLRLLHNWNDSLELGAEVTGASTRYNDTANTKKMNGYALLNLSASYRLTPEWKLELRANNILNKDYVLAYTGNTATALPYNTADSNLFLTLRYQIQP